MLPVGRESTRGPTLLKAIILRGITLDANDDLSLILENMTGATLIAAGPHLYALVKFWYSVVS